MMYENDKLIIPEKYKKMSVSELQIRKEQIYRELRQNTKTEVKNIEYKDDRYEITQSAGCLGCQNHRENKCVYFS